MPSIVFSVFGWAVGLPRSSAIVTLNLEELLKGSLARLIEPVDLETGSAPCRRDPSPLNQVVEGAMNAPHLGVDSFCSKPPFPHSYRRILRIRVGAEVAENQPRHDIVVFREIRPAHGRQSKQLQCRIYLTRKYV